jgi:hypothetical protein
MKITSKYANAQFWADTADRALSTFAQASVGALTVGTTGLLEIDFLAMVSLAGAAALVSILTSVAFRGRDAEVTDLH